MSLTYTVDAGVRLVTITGDYGDQAEWRDLAERLLADGRVTAGFSFIRDLRGAANPVSDATVIETFEVVRGFWPRFKPSKAAIVTRRDDATVAMIVQALADGQELPIRAFDSYESALEWIAADASQRTSG